jgi:membrane dipeptidase
VADARELLSSTEAWDLTLPWLPVYWDIDILRRYHAAGYTFASATLQDWPPTWEGTQRDIATFKAKARPHADWLTFGHTLEEIDRGRAEGKLVLGINSQETSILGRDLSRVQGLYDLGVRHMLLAYNVRNLVADGCAESADAGLSNWGRVVVREMNRVGIILDGTHTGRRSTLEAIELWDGPMIFSHVGAYAVEAHIRNVHDDQIRACAETGGVIGIVGIGSFLGDAEARSETMFRHIDHVAQLVGPEHVGIGTDYVQHMEYVWDVVRQQKDVDWPDPTGTQLYEGTCVQPEQLVEVVQLMLDHGYSEDVVRGILAGNFRRVYAAYER